AGAVYRQSSFDDDYHAAIVKLSGNQRLEALLFDQLYYQLRLYRFRASATTGRARVAFEEHGEIVETIERGDPDAAEAAMRKHIRNAFASLVLRLDGDQAAVAPAALPKSSIAGRDLARPSP